MYTCGEFLCSEITFLKPATLPNIELLYVNFSKVLITIAELYIMVYPLITSLTSILFVKFFIVLPYIALFI